MKFKLLNLLVIAAAFTACQPASPPEKASNTSLAAYDSTRITNDFYDDEPSVGLPGPEAIEVSGEVAEPVKVSLAGLPVRSVIVKETILQDNETGFTGAYQYEGFSLYDILNRVKVVKKNAAEFNPIIDLYVVVYNAEGDSVTFSWGEIYYPVQRHQILIANRVTRIVPTKSKDKWPLPTKTRIIAGTDLVTERNIAGPVRVVIRSLNVSNKVDRSVKMWSDALTLDVAGAKSVIDEIPSERADREFGHVFYGRGMGIHRITKTKGMDLKEYLAGRIKPDRQLIRNGMLVIAGVDGYRCAITWSELMNRNDNHTVILEDRGKGSSGGRISCLITADFFSDRAIKSITGIRLVQ